MDQQTDAKKGGLQPPEPKQPKVFNKGEATMEPTAKLLRFLYIGNDKNVFISQRCGPISPSFFDELDSRLNFIKDMAALRYNLPFDIIKRVILSNTLRRNDEAFLAIAYCLRRVNNIGSAEIVKMQTDIYQGLPELLKTDADLFLFVHISKKILNGDESSEKTSFGRGMKKALHKWYEQRTAEELANIFGRNRGMYKWKHSDIIHMCHMKFGSTADSDKAQLVATLFKPGTATITDLKALQATVPDETWPKAIQRIFHICSLKVNESAADAAEMIQLHNFDIGHLPTHLVSQPQVWNILIPKMNYRELLKVFQMLQTLNMLKATDPLLKLISVPLGNSNLIKASDIHPLEVYPILKLYEKNQRYDEVVKNEWYQKKKVMKLQLEPNPTVVKRLLIGVNHAINTSPQTGCDFCITLDLRASVKKHTVMRMNQVTCLEIMVLLALTFRKREKNTKIYSFSPDDSLVPVKLTTDMTFEKALTHCETLLMTTTKPKLSLPFNYADKNSKNTIFVTIVDSVARFCGTEGEAPIEQFRLYRKTHTHSKFIVINLRRNHGDLQFTYEKGFLEICGMSPDVWKIIHSFATNSFA